jgi:outer membrane protein TolC
MRFLSCPHSRRSRRFIRNWQFRTRCLLAVLAVVSSGCHPIQPHYLHEDGDLSHYLDVATDIEYPDVDTPSFPAMKGNRAPLTIADPHFEAFWDLTLEECISAALHNSKVIRDNGQFRNFGQVVGNTPSRLQTNPDSVATIYDVAIQESSQSGSEQILSNFDAVFNSTVTWDSQDRTQNFAANNVVNPSVLQQDQVVINNEVSKLSVSGAQWFFRHTANYDGTNNEVTRQTRALPSSWTTALETEVRQPLLRGRGVQINRIPVVLARMRTDIALVDFEEAIENLLNSIERAYWELHFQYRSLDAAREGRDSALAAWQKVKALAREQQGSADREAQAREQYYAFSARLTQTLNDVYRTETKLRNFMGIEPSDGRLIRPIDEPTTAPVEFDWCEIVGEALTFSNDLRRQQWQIKSREYELIAAKNQLLPQIDAVGLYRWVGVGDEYNKSGHATQNFPDIGSTAIDSLLEGDFQEFRLGLSSEIPIGFRLPLTRVRNAQLQVVRARARYEETELELLHGLDDAIKNLKVAYDLLNENMNRRIAAAVQVEASNIGLDQGGVDLFNLLQAQRTRADADVAYYQTLTEYNEAILEIHRIKGSLLAYNNVMLAEGPWPEKAYFDAHNLARQRDASYYLDYGYTRPRVVSRGPVNQNRAVVAEPLTERWDPNLTGDPAMDAIPMNQENETSLDGPLPDRNETDANSEMEMENEPSDGAGELPFIEEVPAPEPQAAHQESGNILESDQADSIDAMVSELATREGDGLESSDTPIPPEVLTPPPEAVEPAAVNHVFAPSRPVQDRRTTPNARDLAPKPRAAASIRFRE